LAARLWVDVEDLFEYARRNKRPSGIQRLAFEIYQAMEARYAGTGVVQFVRHDAKRNSFRTIPWYELVRLFETLTESGTEQSAGLQQGILPHPPVRQLVRKWVHRLLPASLRPAVIDVVLAQVSASRAWGRLAEAVWRGARRGIARLVRYLGHRTNNQQSEASLSSMARDGSFDECATQGDILLVLGSPWSHPDYADLVRRQRDRGLLLALLVYDLIPIRRPEWCDRGLVRLKRVAAVRLCIRDLSGHRSRC
jgi:hypothetical protein